MTQPIDREVVVDQHAPSVGDRPAVPKVRPADGGPRHDLASELRASGDWRKTSLGPTADLTGVDLSGEDLRGVDFSNAALTDAHFADAQLADAEFAWARLARADFTGATGLSCEVDCAPAGIDSGAEASAAAVVPKNCLRFMSAPKLNEVMPRIA